MGGKFSNPGKEPTQRQLRVGEEIRHVIADILFRGELGEPELDGVPITVSEVRISPDLKNATVYSMPLGGMKKDTVMVALNRAAPEMRRLLGKRINLRYMPKLTFRLDTTFEEAHKIDTLLNRPEVKRDLENKGE